MSLHREREAAVEAVIKACRLCQSVRGELVVASLDKSDKSPVTVADFGAQAVVSHALQQAFPDDPLVGEEGAADLRTDAGRAIRQAVVGYVQALEPELDESAVLAAIDRGTYVGGPARRFWTLDPIDGTKGFLRNDQYAVALALIENGRPVLGVLGCPSLPATGGGVGCLFIAVEGEQTTERPLGGAQERPVRVSSVAEAAQASFCESVESGHSAHGDSARIAALLGVTAAPVRMDSQAKYAAVARGDASIYLRLPTRADYQERIWDHAAGWMVIRAAGGEVTDVAGKPLDFSLGRTLAANKGVVASNGLLHAAVLAAVRQVLA